MGPGASAEEAMPAAAPGRGKEIKVSGQHRLITCAPTSVSNPGAQGVDLSEFLAATPSKDLRNIYWAVLGIRGTAEAVFDELFGLLACMANGYELIAGQTDASTAPAT